MILLLAASIWMTFGTTRQNGTPMTKKWSKSKPEVEIQYGSYLVSQIGINKSDNFYDVLHK